MVTSLRRITYIVMVIGLIMFVNMSKGNQSLAALAALLPISRIAS